MLVKIKPDSVWMPGKIINICDQPSSYEIEADNKQINRRIRKYLIKSVLKPK